ncbi:8197_t:CDS:1, partial [Cetraspora pellucida]
DNVPDDKRRKTNIRLADICETKIKVIWSVLSKMVQIEQFKNSSDHIYTLSKSNINKHSSIIRTLVTNKAIKNYASVAITNAVRKFAKNDLG